MSAEDFRRRIDAQRRRNGRGGPTPYGDWRDNLRRGDTGRLLSDEENIGLALMHAPELMGLTRFNQLSAHVELTRAPPWREASSEESWQDSDDVSLVRWLQVHGVAARGVAPAAAVLREHASHHAYHPVREWLSGLVWDGEPRIESVLPEILNASGDARYLHAVFRCFMIGAVARAFAPGCKVDNMMVLTGAQGAGKSRFVRQIGSPWVSEASATLGTKDSICELAGSWLIEISELAALRRSEIETLKGFISRSVDHFRRPYARTAGDEPRGSVFVGTTNAHEFLLDGTGNRRFWPIRVGGLDEPLLKASRDQLFAEAVARYRAGEAWHLDAGDTALAAVEQERHYVVSEIEHDTHAFLASLEAAGHREVTVRDVFHAIAGDKERDSLGARRATEIAIGVAIRRRAGWTYAGRRGVSKRTTYRYEMDNGQ